LTPANAYDVPAYACSKLIAYIGNKRALLGFLLSVFREIDGESPVRSFLDPFAGSGSVARLARSLGWRVAANDGEEYSRAVNEAWLGVSSNELPSLFGEEGGIRRAFEELNELHPQRGDLELDPEPRPYIAAHYAPASTESADWRRERLFYTRENAVFLDRARQAIEAARPGDSTSDPAGDGGRTRAAERALLLGALIYEAATHANTSGVFKAYHKGFGGHGRDALGRILSPMRLEPPLLWGGPPSEVAKGDAAAFCASRSVDLCYLDPPYNQHQYGSNYHLLNTIARWDRPPVDDARAPDGSLLRAAGIPPSWMENRSAFCSKRTAAPAFRELLAAVDARTILLSYNTEGLVPPEELVDMLSDGAEVSLRSLDYVKYRGGRQSASRLSRNREILFIARRRREAGISPRDASRDPASAAIRLREELDVLDVDVRLARVLAGAFDPDRFADLCARGGGAASTSGTLIFDDGRYRAELHSYRCLVLEDGAADAAAKLDLRGKKTLIELLEPVTLADNAAACAAAARLIEGGECERRIQALALHWLRKLAHRRYEAIFRELDSTLRRASGIEGEKLRHLAAGLDEVEALFAARLAGSRRIAAAQPRAGAAHRVKGESRP
jgi:adenine-specific DNA-methyltransferase